MTADAKQRYIENGESPCPCERDLKMTTLHLTWSEMSRNMREFYLERACLNTRLASYDWDEFQPWEKDYIRDAVRTTKNITLKEET